jgi:uncharacterized lipoprotein YddW (UPF0748 family)
MKFSILLLAVFSFFTCQSQNKAPMPVKGTWVTNVGSDALTSKEKVAETVSRCKKFGLNTIYVVTWNKGMTMYPSEVLKKYIGIRQDTAYGSFDPISEMVEQGHKAGLRVIAWFEYGFAYDYRDSTSIWLQKYPHWAGRDNKGALLQKNGFYWWNSLHPEVQQFMTALVLEVVKKYKVDGIQGDDRLPAMPAEGGYDDYTKKLYAREHEGAMPPVNHKEGEWVQWRADKLSKYIKDLYSRIKKQKAGCVVSWSPSIFPWSREQYLQDWPAWLKGGYADEVLPQLYRYDIAAYEKILKELDSQLPASQKAKVFPGLLTGLADGYLVKQDVLEQMIRLNRKYGFSGECLFYYESLKLLEPWTIR